MFIFKSTFLSFNIFYKNIKANLAKIAAIKNCPKLATITKIYIFINVAKYFKYLISNYLLIIKLFTKISIRAFKNIFIKLDYIAKKA